MQDSVTVHIDAPPAAVWALVSDLTKIGRYSPATTTLTRMKAELEA